MKGFVDSIYFLGNPIFQLNTPKAPRNLRRISYGQHNDQQMDAFLPLLNESAGLPILVYFHGGGWISGDIRNYDGICAALSLNGFLTFNVNYRLAPRHKFPVQLQDVACAIDWISRHAEEYGGDSSRFFLAGDSAGAQLVSWYASALQKTELLEKAGITDAIESKHLRGVLLFYGVYDFDSILNSNFPFISRYAKCFLGGDPELFRENSKLASPINHITSSLPPVFLCAGERDGLFRQTIEYAKALENKGVACTRVLLPKEHFASHGFLYFSWLRPTKVAFEKAGAFLKGLI
ncbi:MAG: alpha/beta hydrolase [Pseudomonadota bacterium]|nr:alpha/beta hydrolase [Pseudomonadota bacterium]